MAKRSDENAHWSPDVSQGIPEGKRAADFVFDTLAGAILGGQLAVGSVMVGERELAEKFAISRVIIREAIHRLKDMDLVRVKQGGQTVILDPAESSNPRLIPLLIEQATHEPRIVRELAERQLLQGLVLLELAEGRITTEDCDALDEIITRYDALGDESRNAFLREFWLRLAKGIHNQFLWREASFWFQMAERYHLTGSAYMPLRARMDLHREIVRKLRAHDGSAMNHFRASIRPVLTVLTAVARA